MTYNKATKIEVGDKLRSKDGYTFVVNRIAQKTNAANTEKYIIFYGVSTSGFDVYYNHKQIIG